jgi:hypothetical protein
VGARAELFWLLVATSIALAVAKLSRASARIETQRNTASR